MFLSPIQIFSKKIIHISHNSQFTFKTKTCAKQTDAKYIQNTFKGEKKKKTQSDLKKDPQLNSS